MEVKYVVKVLKETTENTRIADATMDTTGVTVYAEGDPKIPSIELSRREFFPIAAFSGYKVVEHFNAWSSMKFSLDTPLPLDVVNFDGSDVDILLQCSGHSRTPIYETPGDDTTPIAGYEYAPQTNNAATMSVDILGTENKFKGHGGKAKFSMLAKVGDPIMMKFDISAAFDALDDGAFTPPFLTPTPSAMLDDSDVYGHVKIGATQVAAALSEIDEVGIDMGADIKQRRTFKTNAFNIANFYPTVSLKGDVDSENPYSIDDVLDGVAKALVWRAKDRDDLSDANDPTSGKVKWEIVVPTMTPDKVPTLSDKDGLGYLDNTFNANPTSGNDNYVIRYYI